MPSMLTTIITPWVSQIFRDILRTVVGPYLVGHGVLNGSNETAALGAAVTLGGIFWGWFTTKGSEQAIALLKKMTATKTHADAVIAAQALPSSAAVDTPSKAAVVKSVTQALLIAFILSAMVTPSAFAQTRKPLALTGNIRQDIQTDLSNVGIKTPTVTPGAQCDFNVFAILDPKNVVTTIQNCVSDANKLFLPDVQAALDSATAFKDTPAIDCLTPAVAIVKAAVGTPAVTAADGTITTPAVMPGVILIFQKFREFTLANGPSACKNWVQSTVNGAVSNAL